MPACFALVKMKREPSPHDPWERGREGSSLWPGIRPTRNSIFLDFPEPVPNHQSPCSSPVVAPMGRRLVVSRPRGRHSGDGRRAGMGLSAPSAPKAEGTAARGTDWPVGNLAIASLDEAASLPEITKCGSEPPIGLGWQRPITMSTALSLTHSRDPCLCLPTSFSGAVTFSAVAGRVPLSENKSQLPAAGGQAGTVLTCQPLKS